MARPPRNPRIPTRDGVSPSCVAVPSNGWHAGGLLDFLSQRLRAVSRDEWARRMACGDVLNDHAQPLPPEAAALPGQRVYYWRRLDHEPEIPFTEHILFEDEHLLVADKPHFLPVIPTGRYVKQCLLVRLKQRTGLATLVPLHRIDRETAGLVVLSKRPQDRGAYQDLFRSQRIYKEYEALALGEPPLTQTWPITRSSRIEPDPDAFFRQLEMDGVPNSETLIEWLATIDAADTAPSSPPLPRLDRYRLTPITGKTHQLRVHMAGLGCPLLGDQLYPRVQFGAAHQEDYAQPLQLLAKKVSFTDPVTGSHHNFVSQRVLAGWVVDAANNNAT
jgi:tRNA pseudouridine32 synthase / 23S rRNA pseudouridine746 synthase